MRLAICSDLHGNPYACEAVLRAMAQMGSFDAILAAGDLCLGGSDPAGCVEQLAEAGALAVYGNTEQYLRFPEQTPPDELHRSMWATIQSTVYWTLDKLSAEQRQWIYDLPFERRFSPNGQTGNDLLCVHANPKDVEMMIYPEVTEQLRLWGEVRQPDDDADLEQRLDGVGAQVVAFGHFHHMFQRQWRGITLADVACRSLPGRERDQRARFSIFEWINGSWVISQQRVTYEIEKEIRALKASDMPARDFFLGYYD